VTVTPYPTWPPLNATPTIPATGHFLLVNQSEQMMYVYEEGVVVRTIPVSTGKPVANRVTRPWRGTVGVYRGGGDLAETNYWVDYAWDLFPDLYGYVLIHSVPYTRSAEAKFYDHLDALGVEPTSHGCVRISPEDGEWLKNWYPTGVPIEITRWPGEIGPAEEPLTLE
jgi:hypothetical protein